MEAKDLDPLAGAVGSVSRCGRTQVGVDAAGSFYQLKSLNVNNLQ